MGYNRSKGRGDEQVERKSGRRTEREGKKGDGVVKVRGKRSERVLRAMALKGAVLRVGWQPGVPDQPGGWAEPRRWCLCFPHSVTQERPLCISGFLIPDSSYNCID